MNIFTQCKLMPETDLSSWAHKHHLLQSGTKSWAWRYSATGYQHPTHQQQEEKYEYKNMSGKFKSRQKEKYAPHQTWILEMLWCSSKAGASLCAPPVHKENVKTVSKWVLGWTSDLWRAETSQVFHTHGEKCVCSEKTRILNMWAGSCSWYFLTQIPQICKVFPFTRPCRGYG